MLSWRWVLCLRIQMERQEYMGKMAGAVGNYNAHVSAYPGVAWDAVAREFVRSLGLQWNSCVTQVPAFFSTLLSWLWGAALLGA